MWVAALRIGRDQRRVIARHELAALAADDTHHFIAARGQRLDRGDQLGGRAALTDPMLFE